MKVTGIHMMPTNEYVEVRNGGYYVAGTRIGLFVVVEEFQGGESPEAILESYPSIRRLGKVYGAIAFILDHPAEVEAYLKDRERLFKEIQKQFPMPQEMLDRLEQAMSSAPVESL
jgi:uncharacterized protein (DUF433 family)